MVHCDFKKGVSKSRCSKYSFGRERGGGRKKECSVYALDDADNSGRPLLNSLGYVFHEYVYPRVIFAGMAEESLCYPNYKHTKWTFILLTLQQRNALSKFMV